MEELTTEQQFTIAAFNAIVTGCSDIEELKKLAIAIHVQLVVQKQMYLKMLEKEWGIEKP